MDWSAFREGGRHRGERRDELGRCVPRAAGPGDEIWVGAGIYTPDFDGLLFTLAEECEGPLTVKGVTARLIAKLAGHGKTPIRITALGITGVRGSTVVDGAVNGDTFEAFVEPVRVPELGPSTVVILDNLSSHNRVRPCELIEVTGVRLVFLPPSRPDLNPIQLIFVKIKPLRRSLACRTRETLWAARPSVLDQVSPADAENRYKHCGYALRLD